MTAFNLISEPWIPCVMLDGVRRTLGLHDTLSQAQHIQEIGGESPLVTAALHRLLVAVLHRNLNVVDSGAWASLWGQGGFDIEELATYFQHWNRRFDLFDDERPFYQVAGLDPAKGGSSARLLFRPDNNPTLFTHLTLANPPALSPAEAARWLLGYMSFDVGGTKTRDKGESTSAKAALLYKGAVVQARGDNLFQTLMFNLCRYAPEEGDPWDFERDADIPAWERNEDTQPVSRRPDGYIDLLTWQSRRIRLEPSAGPDGGVLVRNAVTMNGFSTPDNVLHEMETMLAFRSNPRARDGQDPWTAVAFTEERAIWRDSLALLQSVSDGVMRPKTLQWLGDLASEGIIPHSRIVPVDILGLCSNRAKVLFWRHERLPVPAAYLEDDELAECLQEALELAETTAGYLSQTVWSMAKDMLGIKEPKPKRAEGKRIQELIHHLGSERTYWSRLEAPFRRLLIKLPDDRDEDGNYGASLLPEWRTVLRSAVMASFEESTRSVDRSTRNLRALARAEGFLQRVTYRPLSNHLETDQNESAEPDQQIC